MRLKIEGLTHIYHSPAGEARTVLQLHDWQIEKGEQVLLRGVSGSGKTTLFHILAGLLHPTSGRILYDVQSIYDLHEAARDRYRSQRVGYIFQNHLLLPTLTALENVVMPMAFARTLPSGAWRTRAEQLLKEVGLGEFMAYRANRLSTGQRLRVAIARALANAPGLILADEPTAALDEANGAIVMDLLQTSAHANDAILLVASHDPALTARFRTIADLRAGELHFARDGEPKNDDAVRLVPVLA